MTKEYDCKPCPFCGHQYEGVFFGNFEYRFECFSCGAEGPIVKLKDRKEGSIEAISLKNWNKRAEFAIITTPDNGEKLTRNMESGGL